MLGGSGQEAERAQSRTVGGNEGPSLDKLDLMGLMRLLEAGRVPIWATYIAP